TAAIDCDPAHAGAQQNLGLTYAATGEWACAVRHLRTAHRLRPRDAYVALQLGHALRAAAAEAVAIDGDIAVGGELSLDARAVEGLGRTILADPEFVEAFLALPTSGVDRELFATLGATLEWALERQPEFADLHFHCSRVYQRLGQSEAAIAAANRA